MEAFPGGQVGMLGLSPTFQGPAKAWCGTLLCSEEAGSACEPCPPGSFRARTGSSCQQPPGIPRDLCSARVRVSKRYKVRTKQTPIDADSAGHLLEDAQRTLNLHGRFCFIFDMPSMDIHAATRCKRASNNCWTQRPTGIVNLSSTNEHPLQDIRDLGQSLCFSARV